MGHKKHKENDDCLDKDNHFKLRQSLSPCAPVISTTTCGKFYQVSVDGQPLIVPEDFITYHSDGSKSVLLSGTQFPVTKLVEVSIEKGPTVDSDEPSIVSLDVPSTVSSTPELSIHDNKFYIVRARDEHYKIQGFELIDSTDGIEMYYIEIDGEILPISDIEEVECESMFEEPTNLQLDPNVSYQVTINGQNHVLAANKFHATDINGKYVVTHEGVSHLVAIPLSHSNVPIVANHAELQSVDQSSTEIVGQVCNSLSESSSSSSSDSSSSSSSDSSSSSSSDSSSSQTSFSESENTEISKHSTVGTNMPQIYIPAFAKKNKTFPSPLMGSKVILKQPIVPEMHLYKPQSSPRASPESVPPTATDFVQTCTVLSSDEPAPIVGYSPMSSSTIPSTPVSQPAHNYYPAQIPLFSPKGVLTKKNSTGNVSKMNSPSAMFFLQPMSDNPSQLQVEDKVQSAYPPPHVPVNAGEFTVLTVQQESCIPYQSQQAPIQQYPIQTIHSMGQEDKISPARTIPPSSFASSPSYDNNGLPMINCDAIPVINESNKQIPKSKSPSRSPVKSILKNKKTEDENKLKNGPLTKLEEAKKLEYKFIYPIPTYIIARKATKPGFFSPLNYLQNKQTTITAKICQEFLGISELQRKVDQENVVEVKTMSSSSSSDTSEDSESSADIPNLPGLNSLFEKFACFERYNQIVAEPLDVDIVPEIRQPSPVNINDTQMQDKINNLCGLTDLLNVVTRITTINDPVNSPSSSSSSSDDTAAEDYDNSVSIMLDQLPRLSDFQTDVLAHVASVEAIHSSMEKIEKSDQSDNTDRAGHFDALPGLDGLVAAVEEVDKRALLDMESTSESSPDKQGNSEHSVVPKLLGLEEMVLKVQNMESMIGTRSSSSTSSSSTLNTLRQIDDITSLNSSIKENNIGEAYNKHILSSISPFSDIGISETVIATNEHVYKVLLGGIWYTAKESDLQRSDGKVYFVMIDKTRALVDQCIKFPGINSSNSSTYLCDDKMYNVKYGGVTFQLLGKDIVPAQAEGFFNVIINGAPVQVEPDDIEEKRIKRRLNHGDSVVAVKIDGKWKTVPAHKFVPSGVKLGMYYLKRGTESLFFSPVDLHPLLEVVDMPLGTNVVPQFYNVRLANKDVTIPVKAIKFHSTMKGCLQVLYKRKKLIVRLSDVYPDDKYISYEFKGLQSLSTTNTGTFSAEEYKNNLYCLQIEGKNVNIPGRHIKPHKSRLGYCKMRYRGKIFRIRSERIKLSRQHVSPPTSPQVGSVCSVLSQRAYNQGINFSGTPSQNNSQLSQSSVSTSVSRAEVRYPRFSELLKSVPTRVPNKQALIADRVNKKKAKTVKTKTIHTVNTISASKLKTVQKNNIRVTSRSAFNPIETIPECVTNRETTNVQRTTKVKCGQAINLTVKASTGKRVMKSHNIRLDITTPPQLMLDPLSIPHNLDINNIHKKTPIQINRKSSQSALQITQQKSSKSAGIVGPKDTKYNLHSESNLHSENKNFILTNLRRSPVLICPVSPVPREENNKLFIDCNSTLHMPLKMKASQSMINNQSKRDNQLKQEGAQRDSLINGVGIKESQKMESKTDAYIQSVTSRNRDVKLVSALEQCA